MKYLIVIFLIFLSSCQLNRELEGHYRCDNQGKKYALEIDSDDSGSLSTVFLRKKYVDSFGWTKNDDIINFSNIDTNYFVFDDSTFMITIPSKALYSRGHILFFMDSHFMVFYKEKKGKEYTGEFYYTLKQVSGEESKIIHRLFGDSLTIINKLKSNL